jgi:hypothetical protein
MSKAARWKDPNVGRLCAQFPPCRPRGATAAKLLASQIHFSRPDTGSRVLQAGADRHNTYIPGVRAEKRSRAPKILSHTTPPGKGRSVADALVVLTLAGCELWRRRGVATLWRSKLRIRSVDLAPRQKVHTPPICPRNTLPLHQTARKRQESRPPSICASTASHPVP